MSRNTRKRFARVEALAKEMGHDLVLLLSTRPLPPDGEVEATIVRMPGAPANEDLSVALDKVEDYLRSPEAFWYRDGNAESAAIDVEIARTRDRLSATRHRLSELHEARAVINARLDAGFQAYVDSQRLPPAFETVVDAIRAASRDATNETSRPSREERPEPEATR